MYILHGIHVERQHLHGICQVLAVYTARLRKADRQECEARQTFLYQACLIAVQSFLFLRRLVWSYAQKSPVR